MIMIGVDFHPEFQQIAGWIGRGASSWKSGWHILKKLSRFIAR
jgi:hypothetical protein